MLHLRDKLRFQSQTLQLDSFGAKSTEAFPVGRNDVFVYDKVDQATTVVPQRLNSFLKSCKGFRTVDEHLGEYMGNVQLPVASYKTLQAEVRLLVEAGILLSKNDFLNQLQYSASIHDKPVSSMCFPTRDRPRELIRAVSSYALNARTFGRNLTFIVADGSLDKRIRRLNQANLKNLEMCEGIEIKYIGQNEKVDLANLLATQYDIPSDVANFALLGPPDISSTTVGANRNALLLHTAGELTVFADDDTVCTQVPAALALEHGQFADQSNPVEASFYKGSDMSFGNGSAMDQDFIGLHQEWLGKDLSKVLTNNDTSLLASIDAETITMLLTRPRTIRITVHGTYGDCAWDDQNYFLLQTGESLTRLTESAESYLLSRSSRDIAQVAPRTTLARSAYPLLGMCVGLDNTELLPPFNAVGRAEEISFAKLLERCFRDSYATYLPWMVQHAPSSVRKFIDRPYFDISLGACIPMMIEEADLRLLATPADRLAKIGENIEDLCATPQKVFEEFILRHLRNSTSALIEELEHRLNAIPNLPPPYIQDAEACIEAAQRALTGTSTPQYALPGGYGAFRDLLVRSGQVLIWWPKIVESSKELRCQGFEFARNL